MQSSTWELESAAAYRRREAQADAERERLLAEAEISRPGPTRRLRDWAAGVARCVRSQPVRSESPRML
ncbi:MAG TPA: hypothetical protein VFX03_08145, partial [Thermomicrobiales bacterium]|nr:hypothetical protein [Thermomicrobiales bacterium]